MMNTLYLPSLVSYFSVHNSVIFFYVATLNLQCTSAKN